jgi:nucleotide-binding universal stress UspA family protein
MFSSILVPVDLAEEGFEGPAVATAVMLAKASGAKVRLIHVMQDMPPSVREMMPAEFEKEQRQSAHDQLKALAARLDLPADRISFALRVGDIRHEVIDDATEHGADLIMMRSHRPKFSTYLLGSNAAHIVRHAPCSVFVVREGGA